MSRARGRFKCQRAGFHAREAQSRSTGISEGVDPDKLMNDLSTEELETFCATQEAYTADSGSFELFCLQEGLSEGGLATYNDDLGPVVWLEDQDSRCSRSSLAANAFRTAARDRG